MNKLTATYCAEDSRYLTDLIERVASGDQRRFADLYDATAARVFGMALRVVRDRSHAEEITQEVYLEVWSKADSFDPRRGSPLAWLLTLAHRRAIDRVRAEQSRVDRENRCARMEVRRDYSDVVAGAVIGRLADADVASRLDDLTFLQRQALEMAYYKGLTQLESSRLLGVPVPTIKARTRDAMAKLRRVLEAEPAC